MKSCSVCLFFTGAFVGNAVMAIYQREHITFLAAVTAAILFGFLTLFFIGKEGA